MVTHDRILDLFHKGAHLGAHFVLEAAHCLGDLAAELGHQALHLRFLVGFLGLEMFLDVPRPAAWEPSGLVVLELGKDLALGAIELGRVFGG